MVHGFPQSLPFKGPCHLKVLSTEWRDLFSGLVVRHLTDNQGPRVRFLAEHFHPFFSVLFRFLFPSYITICVTLDSCRILSAMCRVNVVYYLSADSTNRSIYDSLRRVYTLTFKLSSRNISLSESFRNEFLVRKTKYGIKFPNLNLNKSGLSYVSRHASVFMLLFFFQSKRSYHK